MADAFLSHSHHDREMARRLHAALTEAKKEVWADWEDIPPAAKWQRDLDDGVAGSDAFVFLISPDSVSSKYCLAELERADELNKRIVPVVHRSVPEGAMPAALGERNWVPQQGTVDDDFDSCMERVVKAIETDLDWTREHTRWGSHALDWQASDRGASQLLRGEELEKAEAWLARAPGRSPAPTALQREFVHESREYATRSRRMRIGVSSAAAFLLLILGVVTLIVVSNQNEKNSKIDYIRSVGAIINESEKGKREISSVFTALEAISRGEKKARVVGELSGQLDGLIRQRTRLRSRSAALAAPSGVAREMRASLVALFSAKLANNRDIQHCLPAAGDSKRARARLAACLEGTKPTSKRATEALNAFIVFYNRLRREAGLEPTHPVF